MASAPEATPVLPAASVALTVILCAPSVRGELAMDQLPEPSAAVVPRSVVPLLSYSLTVAPASAVPVNVGVVTLVTWSLLEVPLSLALLRAGVDGALGASVSKLSDGVAPPPPLLPAVSV